MPAPYNELNELLPFDDHGWYINGEALEKVICENNVRVVVELGSWLGKSTRHIASILPEDGIVYAVDHWLGSANHREYNENIQPEIYARLPKLYDQFLSNVIHSQLEDRIVPVKMSTLEAVQVLKEQKIVPDLIYVDASHDEESVYMDISEYYPLVKGHGTICGDDWGWGEDFPVMRAVKRFADENNLRIDVPNGWMWVLHEQ